MVRLIDFFILSRESAMRRTNPDSLRSCLCFQVFRLNYLREANYAKNHFQQNRYSVFEGHVMRKESISTKTTHGNSEVV